MCPYYMLENLLGICPGLVWLDLLMIKDVEHFLGASQTLYIPHLRILCLALYPIFNRIIWFSGIQFLEFFIYIGY